MAMERDAVPEEEEDRRIYFRVEKSAYQSPEGKLGMYDWYAIDDKDELLPKDKEGFLEPVFERLPKCQYMSAFVALGPYICVIGGLEIETLYSPSGRNIYSDVCYIDTRCPHNGWKQAPPLIKPRADPHAFVVDGKIYVLAALWNSDHPWAEVFNPCRGKWSPLPMHSSSIPLPHDILTHAVRYDSNGKPQQLMAVGHISQALYSYDFGSQKWTLADKKLGPDCGISAFVGDIMYCFSDGEVLAYDLTKLKWFPEPVRGFEYEEVRVLPPKPEGYCYTPDSDLVHVGNGVLCLLWGRKPCAGIPLEIYCTKFTVSMKPGDSPGKCILVAHIKYFNVYKVKGLSLEGCVVASPSAKNRRFCKKNRKKTTKSVQEREEKEQEEEEEKHGQEL